MTIGFKVLGPPILVRERAFEQVRDAIISGRLAPGTRLIERELCEAMGISRASVREVIRRLEAERLVESAPRRGPMVVTLTRKQADEIYEIRATLESLLVRHFTEMATDEEIVTLHAIFDEVKRAAKMGAAQEAVALMLRFNDHLVTVSHHDITRDLLNLLNARIHLLRVTSISKPGRLAASLVEISAVLDAVRRRDPELAARNMTIYVCNARDAALEQLSSP